MPIKWHSIIFYLSVLSRLGFKKTIRNFLKKCYSSCDAVLLFYPDLIMKLETFFIHETNCNYRFKFQMLKLGKNGS